MKWFKTLNGIKKYLIKYGNLDFFKFKGVIYTQEMYDFQGKELTYKNKRTTNQITVETENRYKTGYKDAIITLDKNIGFYRNDISFID